jgi:two-component system chemotaxis response regulator CheB
MAQRPIPIVICSTIAEVGSDKYLEALAAGAVDVVAKPAANTAKALQEAGAELRDVARAAASARLRRRAAGAPVPIKVEAKLSADAVIPVRRVGSLSLPATDPIVCIGASTGGTEAILEVIERLPVDCPPVLVVQHMPERFTAGFARRLDSLCAVEVKEAQDGDRLVSGRVLIAQGGRHLAVARTGLAYSARVVEGPPVSRHRPSVDVLFRSAAQQAGVNALGILLTGMGDDGAAGLFEMRQAGAATIAQDEASSVVFGMPREAIQRGAAERILPLHRMAREIVTFGARPPLRRSNAG